MAGNMRVRGITIDINADVRGLSESFREVSKDLESTKRYLKDVDYYLKQFDGKDVGLLAEKHLYLSRAIQQVTDKIGIEKTALAGLKNADQTEKVRMRMKALEEQIMLDETELRRLNEQFKNVDDRMLEEVTAELEKTKEHLGDINDYLGKLDGKDLVLLYDKQQTITKALDQTYAKLELEKSALAALKDADSTPEVNKRQEELQRQIFLDENEVKLLQQELSTMTDVGARKTEKLREAFEKTDKTLKDTKGYLSDLDGLLKNMDISHTELLREKQEALKDAAAQTTDKIIAIKDQLNDLANKDQTPDVVEKQKELERQLVLEKARFEELQRAAEDFGSVAKQQALELADKFEETGEKISAFGSSLFSTGRYLTSRVTTPIVGAGKSAVEASMEFETAMDKVNSVTLDATAEQMEMLSAAVLDMSGKSKYSASEAAEALYYMGLAGWDVDEMLAALPHVLNVATAGEMDLGRASDIVTDYFTAFGEGAGTVENMVDVMAKTMVSSNTDIDQLGEAFKYVAPVAGAFGYTIEDVSFALGLMANNGIKGSQAGTSLRQFMQRLAKPTEEVAGAMKELGISLADNNGEIKPFRDIMDELRESLGETVIPADELTQQIALLDDALENGEISEEEYSDALNEVMTAAYGVNGAEKAKNAAILAGVRGMSGLLAIVNATSDDYNDLSDAIGGATTAQDIANMMIDNTQGRYDILKHSIQNVGISLGEQLIPQVERGITWIQGLIQKFSELDDGTKETIVNIAAGAAAFGPLLVTGGSIIKGIGSIVSGLGSMIKVGTSVVSMITSGVAAAGGILQFMAANPLGIAVGLLAAIAAAIGVVILKEKAHQAELEAERQAVYGLSQEQQALIEKIDAAKDAYASEMSERAEYARSVDSEIGYLQSLQDELGRLVDEHGKVKEGYEERVEFILNELNSALDTEYSLNNGLIEDYQAMQAEISKLIDAKRQEFILQAGEEKYRKAIEKSADAYHDYTAASEELEKAKEGVAAAQKNLNDYEKKYASYSKDSKALILQNDKAYQELQKDLDTATETEKAMQAAMEDSQAVYLQTQTDIENYGAALEAVASGDTQAARDALNMLLYDFQRFDTATEQQLRDQVNKYQAMYDQAQRDIAAGVAGVSKETVDGYARMVVLAQGELDKYNNAVTNSGKKAVETAGQYGTKTGEATKKGLSSTNMSGPGSEHINQYVGALGRYEYVKTKSKQIVNTVKDGLTSVNMTGPGSEHINQYVGGLSKAQTVDLAAKQIVNTVKTNLTSVNMSGPGSDHADQYASGIDSGRYTVELAAQKMAEAAYEAGKIDGTDSGANFSLGVAKGIRDYIYTIEEAANEAAAAGKRGFNKPIAIMSPSRVMMESGKNFDLGVAIGIKDNADKVIDEASKLATDTASAMAYDTTSLSYGLSRGAGGIGAKVFNIGGVTINQQPGEDASELADRVIETIYREVYQRQAVAG